MKTLQEILNHCSVYLEKHTVPNAKLQAERTVAAALRVKRIDLYMDLQRPVTGDEAKKIKEWVVLRAKRTPLAYIEKKADFYGIELEITPDVLIPRQETEILVDTICKFLKNEPTEGKILVDVCTGSGCIAIAIKKRFPQLRVIATDICPKALKLAQTNALKNGVEITFLQGDMLGPCLKENIDYLVSNPPYIKDKLYPDLENEVRDFEPKIALLGGDKGLDFYIKLENQLKQNPSSQIKIWLEMGYDQKEALEALFSSPDYHSKKVYQDYSSKDRFFFLERRVKNSYSNVSF